MTSSAYWDLLRSKSGWVVVVDGGSVVVGPFDDAGEACDLANRLGEKGTPSVVCPLVSKERYSA